jgi:hypothetical protein
MTHPVPLRPREALPQAKHAKQDARRRQSSRLRHRRPRVPDGGSAGAGRGTFGSQPYDSRAFQSHEIDKELTVIPAQTERSQGPQSQAHHPATSAAGHPWRRGARHADPRHHRLWWRATAHQQGAASEGGAEEEEQGGGSLDRLGGSKGGKQGTGMQ